MFEYLCNFVTCLGLRPIHKFNIQYILTCVVVGVCYIHYTHSNTGDIRTIQIQYVVLIKTLSYIYMYVEVALIQLLLKSIPEETAQQRLYICMFYLHVHTMLVVKSVVGLRKRVLHFFTVCLSSRLGIHVEDKSEVGRQ